MINPIKLEGNWTEGFALDIHVIKSIYVGENQYGRPEFDTIRSRLGELVYQLKYRNNPKAIYDIMELIEPFLNKWNIINRIDAIIPVPSSDKNRIQQPVFKISEHIAKFLNKPIFCNLLEKVTLNQIKDVNFHDKEKLIKGTIRKSKHFTRSVNLLLVDDLYQTGSTLKEVCNVLKQDENVNNIYVLTMTKTKG